MTEDRFSSGERGGQWSKNLLGGIPLFCEGISLIFSPMYNDIEAQGCSKLIKLCVDKKKLTTPPDV